MVTWLSKNCRQINHFNILESYNLGCNYNRIIILAETGSFPNFCADMYVRVYLPLFSARKKVINRFSPKSQQTYWLRHYGNCQSPTYNGEGGYWGRKSNIGRMGVRPWAEPCLGIHACCIDCYFYNYCIDNFEYHRNIMD